MNKAKLTILHLNNDDIISTSCQHQTANHLRVLSGPDGEDNYSVVIYEHDGSGFNTPQWPNESRIVGIHKSLIAGNIPDADCYKYFFYFDGNVYRMCDENEHSHDFVDPKPGNTNDCVGPK